MRFPPEGKQHEITALVVGAGQEVSKRIAVRQLPLSHEGLAR
jgi:hypothetical protein